MKLKEKPRPEVISSMIIQNMMPAHFFINGLEETIGPDDLEKLLKSIPNSTQYKNEILPDPLQPVRQKMNELYGPTGARGIAMCSGKAGFKYILKQQSKQLGFESDAFRFLPGKYKLKRGLSLLADWMMEIYHEGIQIENADKHWLFNITGCYECSGFQSSTKMCDFTAGLLQEFMSWAGGGKYYRIEELSCRGQGDELCSFQIDKNPID
jgi:predicted hydrocarbon binding protein